MFSKLEILKKNSIFLFVGSRDLYFIRFLSGKIYSTRLYKASYNTEADSLKSFFKDYLLGKEGVPIVIFFDIPHQVFTEYRFLKTIGKIAVQHSIIKKISQDTPQDAIHDYYQISIQDAKHNENVYQVTSLIKTATVSACLEILQKFPNPIAGNFSMTLEIPTICEGGIKKIPMAKPIPILETNEEIIKNFDELTVCIQYSPISGINFSISQDKRIIFHHHIVCYEIIDQATQKEINTTSITILDYLKQFNVEYKIYIYGSENLLKSILQTEFDQTLIYYTQSELQNAQLFYHKDCSENLSTVNTLDAIAFKSLHSPSFFIQDKNFFNILFKYYSQKILMILIASLIIITFVYQLFMSFSAALESFTKYRNAHSLDISNVIKRVDVMEKNISEQKKVVNFYSSFSTDLYLSFFEQIIPLIKRTSYIKSIEYSCSSECYSSNAIVEINITGNATDLQDYYSFVSDLRRILYKYEITRKIDESTNDFSVQITNQINNKK